MKYVEAKYKEVKSPGRKQTETLQHNNNKQLLSFCKSLLCKLKGHSPDYTHAQGTPATPRTPPFWLAAAVLGII